MQLVAALAFVYVLFLHDPLIMAVLLDEYTNPYKLIYHL